MEAQRHAVVIAHGGHAASLFQAFAQTLAKGISLLGVVTGRREIELCERDSLRVEPWAHAARFLEVPEEQSGADQRHHGEADLGDHQQSAQAVRFRVS